MPTVNNEREGLHPLIIGEAITQLERKLSFRLKEKGSGTFKSRHEILGIVTEEHFELIDAVKSGTLEEVKQELLDIAVGALFGIASIEAKGVDW